MRIHSFNIPFPLKRLSTRLIFFVSLGVIACTVVLYFFISSAQQKLTFDSFYTSVNGTLQAAKLGIQLSHTEEKYDMMVEVLEWIKKRDHFKYIYLTEEADGQEEMLYTSDENILPLTLNNLFLHKSIHDSIYVLKSSWKSKNGNGNIYIGFSTDKIRAYERQIIVEMTTFSLLSVIIIILIIAFITKSVTKPLNDLKNTTDKIRNGDLNERANEIKGGIEVTTVSAAFNQMVNELSRTQKELSNEIYEAGLFVQSILPAPINSDFKIDWKFLPSRDLGGDAFGYHYLDDSHLAIYLIDVSGHGVGPALLSVSVINILRNQSLIETDFFNPSIVLASLNSIFQMDKNGDKFFTAWYGVLDVKNLELTYCAAGHPPAILIKQTNNVKVLEELSNRNNFIGLMPNIEFESDKRKLSKTDKLFIYSDGLYEIVKKDGKVLEKEKFLQLVLENSDSLEMIITELLKIEKHNQFSDDCSVISLTL